MGCEDQGNHGRGLAQPDRRPHPSLGPRLPVDDVGRGLNDGGHHWRREAAKEQELADRVAGPLEDEENATDDQRG